MCVKYLNLCAVYKIIPELILDQRPVLKLPLPPLPRDLKKKSAVVRLQRTTDIQDVTKIHYGLHIFLYRTHPLL